MTSGAERALAVASRLQSGLTRLAGVFGAAGALAVLGITGLLVVSSIKRYLFQSPVPATEELGSLLFLALGLLSIGFGFTRGRHVRMDIVWRRFPARLRPALEAAGLCLAVPALALLVRETWDLTVFSYEIGARSDMNELNLWPWRLVLPLGLGMLALVVAARAAVIILSLICNREVDPRADQSELPLH